MVGPFQSEFWSKKDKKTWKILLLTILKLFGLWFFLQKIPKINLLKWKQTRKGKNNMSYLNFILLRSEIINFPATHDGWPPV